MRIGVCVPQNWLLIQEHKGYHNMSKVSSMEVWYHPYFMGYVYELIIVDSQAGVIVFIGNLVDNQSLVQEQ